MPIYLVKKSADCIFDTKGKMLNWFVISSSLSYSQNYSKFIMIVHISFRIYYQLLKEQHYLLITN